MAEKKFEDAMLKLEELVRKLEGGDLSLEESIKVFEEGIRLAGLCTRKLDEAERRIEVLIKGEQDRPEIKPFEGGENNDG